MPKLLTLAGYAAALLLALLLFRSCDAHARDSERYKIEAARSDSLLAARTAEASRRDTVFRRDTVRLTRALVRWDTARVTDTLVRDSVVYIPLAVADSAVNACVTAFTSCVAARQADADVIRGLRARVALEQGHQPGFWQRQRDRFGVCVGYGVSATPGGEVTHGAQVGLCAKILP